MKHQLHQLRDKFNGQTDRERGFIVAALLSVLIVVLFFPSSDLSKKNTDIETQIKSLISEKQLITQQTTIFEASLSEDPNAGLRSQLDDLQQQLTEIEAELEKHNVVAADAMPTLLNTMMSGARQVTVTGFESLPPKSLLQEVEQSSINLYSHSAKLTLKGKYFDIIKFLQAIESLPQKIYWKNIDYQVKEYPLAQVSLEFYTLSVNKEYIGVAY